MKPPTHLSPEARKWWAEIHRIYALESPHLRLLTLAAEAWDRSRQARQELKTAGSLTYTDRNGVVRPHPCVRVEENARASFAALVKQLRLDEEDPKSGPGRPLIRGEF